MDTHLFDVNGWHYSQEAVRRIISTLAFDGKESTDRADELEFAWENHGGKAFGLRLCDYLVQGTSLDEKIDRRLLRVPSYMSVSWSNDYVLDELQTGIETWLKSLGTSPSLIVRSSNQDEDWVDPRAGLAVSKPIYDLTGYQTNFNLATKVRGVLREHLDTKQQVVVQQLAEGYGCVIDIGYSELLGRTVFRLAIGNKSVQGSGYVYTSATWDTEARVYVYDALTAEPILPTGSHEFETVVPELIRYLVPRLQSLYLTFGVQLEMIVNPYQPKVWNLVQLRPSPDMFRGQVPARPSGEPLLTTFRVNQPGEVTAGISIVKDRSTREDLQLRSVASQLGRDYIIHGHETDQECYPRERAAIQEKVVIWQESPDKYGGSIYQVLGMGKLGAVAQIAPRALFPNSGHGTYAPFTSKFKDHYQAARRQGLLFTVGSSGILQLCHMYRTNPDVRVRLVSDGLVGQVYIVE